MENEALFSHKWHCLVYYKGNALAISGEDTRAVEAFNLETRNWVKMPKLPKRRCGASAVVLGSKVYVLGGKSKKLSKKIFEFNNKEWRLWDISLPQKLMHIGVLSLGKKMILVFGGEVQTEGDLLDNTDAWEVDLHDGEAIEGRGMPRPLKFSCY